MRADEALTTEERDTLDAIEAALVQPHGHASLVGTDVGNLAALLRESAPRADEQFRQRLRAELLTTIERRTPARRFTRRQMLAAGLTAATLGGAVFAAPQARAALVALLNGRTPTRTLSAPVVERGTRLPLDLTASPSYWVGPENAQRVYFLTNIYRERWVQRQQLQAPLQAGDIVTLPNGAELPIPAYLPAPFRWQGITATNEVNVPFQYITEKNGGGGGDRELPWARFPPYDNKIGAYLIGGDPNDHFLILQQFRVNPNEAIIVSTFQVLVPTTVPPIGSPKVPPSAGLYGERTTLGVIVEPARDDQVGISIQAGAGALQPAAVAGATAWQFGGVWTADGQWHDDGTWRSLVWSRDGYLYCLSAEQLPAAELLRVAESLPALP